MTRYDLFNELAEKCKLIKTDENQYNKMIQSGELVNTHYDYGRGYYDVSIRYINVNKTHTCRIWFGTIDDGDYGSWNEFPSKEKACKLVEDACDIFKDITTCPSHQELNILFRKLGIYFSNE